MWADTALKVQLSKQLHHWALFTILNVSQSLIIVTEQTQRCKSKTLKLEFHWGNTATCCMQLVYLSTRNNSRYFQHLLNVTVVKPGFHWGNIATCCIQLVYLSTRNNSRNFHHFLNVTVVKLEFHWGNIAT